MTIQGKGPDTIVEIGLRDGGTALYRVHERHLRTRSVARHQVDLRHGGHVIAVKAGLPQGLDDPRRGVGLDGVENVAAKVSLEPLRRYGQDVGAHKCDRTFRGPLTDQVQGRLVRAQFT